MIKYSIIIFLIILNKWVNGLEMTENSEIDTMGLCGRYDVCNLVYSPYFGISKVDKLCKCPESTPCSATFDRNDNKSLLINTRTQMKFCSPVVELLSELPECEDGKEALEVKKFYYVYKVKNISSTILCGCNKQPVYWKHHSRLGEAFEENEKLFKAVDLFECADLRKCNMNEFCGLARTDYGFIFQRCTCSYNADCRYFVEEEDMEESIEELFYNELFYKAHCLRKEGDSDW